VELNRQPEKSNSTGSKSDKPFTMNNWYTKLTLDNNNNHHHRKWNQSITQFPHMGKLKQPKEKFKLLVKTS
jgi:hypothetical protein